MEEKVCRVAPKMKTMMVGNSALSYWATILVAEVIVAMIFRSG